MLSIVHDDKNEIHNVSLKPPQNVAENSVFCHSGFTGKELDLETGYSYFGARYLDNALSTAWLSVDPMSDKYPSISPYAYCSWNPVKLVDPDGEKIIICGESGEIVYYPGMSSDGYTKFEKDAIDALNIINSTKEGFIMLANLCNNDKKNDTYIEYFAETTVETILPDIAFYDTENNIPGNTVGAEFLIRWESVSPEKLCTLEGMVANSTYNLLDEICHVYDYCTGYAFNSTDDVFGEDYSKNEIQAVYRSNVVRHQLNDENYRCHYYHDSKDTHGVGVKTASKDNEGNFFYRPSWYPQCKTENVSVLSVDL